MPDLEGEVRRYADAAVAAVEPVTADEVRHGLTTRAGLLRGLAVAAVLLVVLGVVASVVVSGNGADRRSQVVTAAAPDLPLTLDGHLEWERARLSRSFAASEDDYEERYSDAFREAVPFDAYIRVLDSVPPGPWSVLREIERRGDDVLAVQLASESGEQVRLTMLRGEDGRLSAATILLPVPCADPVDPSEATLATGLARQFEWVTSELFVEGVDISDDELERRFADSFRQSVPVPKLREFIEQIRPLGPVTLRSYEGPPTATSVVARMGLRTGEELRLSLTVAPGPEGVIAGLVALTQQPCRLPTP